MTLFHDRLAVEPSRSRTSVFVLLLAFALFLTFGHVNFCAHANELSPGWKLEKKTDKLTAETTCQVIKQDGPIFVAVGQMACNKDVIWAEISSYSAVHITRFKIGSNVYRAGPVRTVLLESIYLPSTPNIDELMNVKTLSVEYKNRADGDSHVIEFNIDHIREAVGRLRQMYCQ